MLCHLKTQFSVYWKHLIMFWKLQFNITKRNEKFFVVIFIFNTRFSINKNEWLTRHEMCVFTNLFYRWLVHLLVIKCSWQSLLKTTLVCFFWVCGFTKFQEFSFSWKTLFHQKCEVFLWKQWVESQHVSLLSLSYKSYLLPHIISVLIFKSDKGTLWKGMARLI